MKRSFAALWWMVTAFGSQIKEAFIMFDEQYPTLAEWILSGAGWIELGQEEYSDSLVRILDIGGMLWESEKSYATVAEALAEAEEALKQILAEW